MQTTRKTIRIFVIIALIAGCLLPAQSEITTVKKQKQYFDNDPVTEVYWFYLRVKADRRKKAYSIVGTGSRVISGTMKEFEKAVWWGTTRGQLAIGPFLKHKEATDARLLYRRSRKKIKKRYSIEDRDEVYWFLITFSKRKRSNSYQLEPMPARVYSGSIKEFLDALYEGLDFERVTIGPFWDYMNAKDAKDLYGKNE